MARRSRKRTRKGGCLRIDRVFRGVGRIQLTSKTRSRTEYRRRDALLTKLYESSQLETLIGIRRGKILIEDLVLADRDGRLQQADSLLALHRPLWAEVRRVWPDTDLTVTTRRYRTSFAALETKLGRREKRMQVRDLQRLEWKTLRASWGKSGSDWNHLRRAVSAFLTIALGSTKARFRTEVLELIPLADEHERVPDVTPAQFWRAVEALPHHARPAIVTLAVTGLRLGEYLRCTPEHLRPGTRAIEVPGTKTQGSAATIRVDPALWAWVEAGVPAPLGERWLRKYWNRACKNARLKNLRLQDLRHCFAQWATDGGATEGAVQSALRHRSPTMTRRYTRKVVFSSNIL